MNDYLVYYTLTIGGQLYEESYKAMNLDNLRKRLLEEYGGRTYVHLYIAKRMSNGTLQDLGQMTKWIDPMLWKSEKSKTWMMLDPKTGKTKGEWKESDSYRYKQVMKKAGRF